MSILVTGGTGSFGQAFVRYLLQTSGEDRIIVYSRGEYAQHLMVQALKEHAERLRFMIGDVRDKDRLCWAFKSAGWVVHAAALKRIEVGHYNPIEMIKTNVQGTANVVEACLEAGVKRAVLLSSDKAFQPVSPYGVSKAMGESLFLNANNTAGWTGTSFRVCRYGNVWKSTGSVVPLWLAARDSGEDTVTVTDPECTRFFMRMNEAIGLVRNTLHGDSEKTQIPILPAYRLGDLAEAMGLKMNITGLPAWEKRHESMAEGNSSDKARRMSIAELKDALNE